MRVKGKEDIRRLIERDGGVGAHCRRTEIEQRLKRITRRMIGSGLNEDGQLLSAR